MAIYALSDLHLSLSNPEKSMDVFGSAWDGYIERIERGWRETVTDSDTVLVAGDISWATYIEKAEEDFAFLASLPGRKLISRGNHDYWWTTMKKLDEFFASHDFPGIEIVRTNVLEAEGCLISGTRGWMLEGQCKTDDDRKVYDREIQVDTCIYGHLHGRGRGQVYEGEDEAGVNYVCTSADYLDFTPVRIRG